jgi:hypothetical protein
MPQTQQSEHLAEDTKTRTHSEQEQAQQEREQPWKKIMPEIEALNKANADDRETYVCDQGFYSQSLAA